MSDLNYEFPNPDTTLKSLIPTLKFRNHIDLASLLAGSKLTFNPTTTYAPYMGGKKWNAYGAYAVFGIHPNDLEEAKKIFGETGVEAIINAFRDIMPADCGYEIVGVTVVGSAEAKPMKRDTITQIKKIAEDLPSKVKEAVLPEDILQKAKEMSEVYLYTYCAENALRAFIEAIARKNYSDDYMTKLKMNGEMVKKITQRKQLQQKKKWLSARGSSDIFFLDVGDLGWLIANNWDIFKPYFDRIDWVTVNINEIADCRNQVAHHSYLEEHERNIIRDNFIKILKQIGDTFK
jgi:hypothetical protein